MRVSHWALRLCADSYCELVLHVGFGQKVKVISRSEEKASREFRSDVVKVHRNTDPKVHPLERAREVCALCTHRAQSRQVLARSVVVLFSHFPNCVAPVRRCLQYARALTAVKMDRIFAKPFVGALSGHMDSVTCSAVSPKALTSFVSGSADGEVRVWDLASQRALWSVAAHRGHVRGLTVTADGGSFMSCGDDGAVKLWALTAAAPTTSDDGGDGVVDATSTWTSRVPAKYVEPLCTRVRVAVRLAPVRGVTRGWPRWCRGIDHHWTDRRFATCSTTVDIWEHARSEPLHTFEWGADSVCSVRWNPAETYLLGATANDRSLALYDVRGATPIRKVTLDVRFKVWTVNRGAGGGGVLRSCMDRYHRCCATQMRSNRLAWNPREPFNFTVVRAWARLPVDMCVRAGCMSMGASWPGVCTCGVFGTGKRGL